MFKKKYSEFNDLLHKLDRSDFVKKLNKKNNINFYNTFRHLGNRDFAGLKILEFTLTKFIKQKNQENAVLWRHKRQFIR